MTEIQNSSQTTAMELIKYRIPMFPIYYMKQSTFANGLARKILVLFASASIYEDLPKPSLFACIAYGRRGRLSLSIRLLVALDTSEWAFNGGI